ncbi:GTPase-GDP dissociation stimulator vimar isoform X2 [Pectinophora gossypiella]|uniref:GTPase-GDP dissociation stimulator vimar isoform X2 n=1 Tax=Pectinophora gossypiella TaxID=13191 RepID=UPI00214F4328|nr:GTPase-GDP dissociation stimulator vimar isoform X2 [Pectinophora gossypiella]
MDNVGGDTGSTSSNKPALEVFIIRNIDNEADLITKLNEIIDAGKDYKYDISACLVSLIKREDQQTQTLIVQAIAELAKCEDKRELLASEKLIEPILNLLRMEMSEGLSELLKQCVRALGNLCCDCDKARHLVYEYDGMTALLTLLKCTLRIPSPLSEEIKLLTAKSILNIVIGGEIFIENFRAVGFPRIRERERDQTYKHILNGELKKDDMNDDLVSTALLTLSVINDFIPAYQFHDDVNMAVLNMLRVTNNLQISELCLDHLHTQAEHDTAKTMMANEKGVQLVCERLELLLAKKEAGELISDDAEVESLMKQACDLIIMVLTGDEAMHLLYNHGEGEVYKTMVGWLTHKNLHLLTTSILAIGNFARQDDYCMKMMEDKIYDRLLDIFEKFHNLGLAIKEDPNGQHPVNMASVTKIQHAVLSALRNLTVPMQNKKVAAKNGRAAPIFLDALPTVEDHHVAYKLLAAIRMLVDGQEAVAIQLASHPAALAAVARWCHAGEFTGASGEAPRLLAWAVKMLRRQPHWRQLIQVEGCVPSLVNMLMASHSVMQNEAILALTLLARECLKPAEDEDVDYEQSFINQLLKSEIGKHLSVLIETNCAKMPVEVAHNLLVFLDITSEKNKLAMDYKEAKVHDSLKKFKDSRNDFSKDLVTVVNKVRNTIEDNGIEME